VGERLKLALSEVRSRLANGERAQLDEITAQEDVIFSDLAAFLATLDPSPLELDLADVREIVGRALFTASPSTRHLVVERRLAETPEIVCDAESIHEAFLNIILNAAEAMREGGTLTVTSTRPDDESVAVSFRDTGGGIDAETMPRIFQFGYSTKVFGSGLGLSQARESVRLHGGRIEVESAVGKGTTFTVVLPLSPEIRPTVQDLTLRPVLFEDPQELMLELAEDEGLLMM
jgi:signal transduction histidine kinase